LKDVGHKANESVSKGVDVFTNAVENAKETIGVHSKKTEHAADELQDEAKLHIKKAARDVDEIKKKAAKATKEVKHKATH
jgi:hypothetical protein